MVFYLTSCGCSTVVVHQLPKLCMRVRFPSPAPFILNSLSTAYNALKSIQKTRYQSVKFRFISTHGTLNQCFKCPISYHSQAEKSRGCCTATVLHPHDIPYRNVRLFFPGWGRHFDSDSVIRSSSPRDNGSDSLLPPSCLMPPY